MYVYNATPMKLLTVQYMYVFNVAPNEVIRIGPHIYKLDDAYHSYISF